MIHQAPNCPTCLPRKIIMWWDGDEFLPVSLVNTWRCLECGTIVKTKVPVEIVQPVPTDEKQP